MIWVFFSSAVPHSAFSERSVRQRRKVSRWIFFAFWCMFKENVERRDRLEVLDSWVVEFSHGVLTNLQIAEIDHERS